MQVKLLRPDVILLRESAAIHIAELNNEIVTCPDPRAYPIEIQLLELKRARLECLRALLTRYL